MENKLKRAVEILHREQVSCVILDGKGEAYCSCEIGIKPLMVRLRKDKKAFAECAVADKVVGKAAALMAVLGGADSVFGEVLSIPAENVLRQYGVYYEYAEKVPYIENRSHTGKCPMEAAVARVDSPEEAFEILEQTIQKLMQNK